MQNHTGNITWGQPARHIEREDVIRDNMEALKCFGLYAVEIDGIYHKKMKLDMCNQDQEVTMYRHGKRDDESIYFSTRDGFSPIPMSGWTYPARLRGKGYKTPDGKTITSKTTLNIKSIMGENNLTKFFH